jgi:flavin reductase (DIM6/NTAB) family NADH-FMN oxidoreductase RutF
LPHLGISVLSAEHDTAARVLAAKNGDRFAGIETETHSGGAVFVAGCGIWMDVTVDQEVLAGDHTIVVMRINTVHSDDAEVDIEPIVFHRSGFRRLAF